MIEGRIRNSTNYSATFNGDEARRNHLSLLVAVVGPFLSAFSLGFMFGLAVGVSAGFVEQNWRVGLMWGASSGAIFGFLSYSLFIFLWWWMRIRLEEELGWNLSYKSKLKKELTFNIPDGHGHMSRVRLVGIDDEAKLVRFARLMVANPSRSTAKEAWTSGDEKLFTRPEYAVWREFLFANGHAVWNSPADHARGWSFTRGGWTYLKWLAAGRFTVDVVDTTPKLAGGLTRAEFGERYGKDLTPLDDAR